MANAQTDAMTSRKPLRLWPGIAAAVLLLVLKFVVPRILPDAAALTVFGGMIGSVLIVLWWLFFSRAAWVERIGALILIFGAVYATKYVVHESIAGGAMGYLLPVLAGPLVLVALVAWAAATRNLSTGARRATLVATILMVCGAFTLIRTGGFSGDFKNDLHWRWTETPEERLMAASKNEPPAPVPEPVPAPAATPAPEPAAAKKAPTERTAAKAEEIAAVPSPPKAMSARETWPGFRGANRAGIVPGVQINTDWSASKPAELWRRPIGPGWSSFAVQGDLIYTQEQRGQDEMVTCYSINTGKPVWRHRDAARFWESNGGAGPRATPTLSNGRVYTLGGTGILNVLDAGTGRVIWSRNAVSDTGAKIPIWGISGSPLVVGDIVIVAASGKLAAYDLATGKPRWRGPDGAESYSSPQLATIDGVQQILFVNGDGIISVAPADGSVLWKHLWKGYPIVQPALTADGDVLISVNESSGTRRLAADKGPGGWTVTERWTSNGLKPYFNDFVVHKGHAFGFDGSILACIDLQDGKRKWKGGRYGNGQLVLLPDEDLLLVLSEEGELALVKATTDQFTEVARIPAIEGKTWNHPVVAGDVLLVRNGEEMAAFRLARLRR